MSGKPYTGTEILGITSCRVRGILELHGGDRSVASAHPHNIYTIRDVKTPIIGGKKKNQTHENEPE